MSILYNPLVVMGLSLGLWAAVRIYILCKLRLQLRAKSLLLGYPSLILFTASSVLFAILTNLYPLGYVFCLFYLWGLSLLLILKHHKLNVANWFIGILFMVAVVISFLTSYLPLGEAVLKVVTVGPALVVVAFLLNRIGGSLIESDYMSYFAFGLAGTALNIELLPSFFMLSTIFLLLQALISKALFNVTKTSFFSCLVLAQICCIIAPMISEPVLFIMGSN